MSTSQKVMTGREFVEHLAIRGDARSRRGGFFKDEPITVNGDVILNHSNRPLDGLASLDLPNDVVINGSLHIDDYPLGNDAGALTLRGLNVHGIYISGCTAGHLNVADVTASHIQVFRCTFGSVHIMDIHVAKTLDISGIRSEKLMTLNAEFGELHIHCPQTDSVINVPGVVTKSPVVARRFHLAMIPVYTTSDEVAKMQ